MDLNTVQSPLNYTSNRRPDWESLVLKVNQTWPVLKVMTLFSFCPHPPTVNQSDGDYWPTVFCRTILRAFSMPGEPAVVALRCLMAAAWPGWSLLQPLEKERSTTCRWPSEPIPAAQVSVILVIKTFLIFLTQKLTTSFLDQFSRFRNSAAGSRGPHKNDRPHLVRGPHVWRTWFTAAVCDWDKPLPLCFFCFCSLSFSSGSSFRSTLYRFLANTWQQQTTTTDNCQWAAAQSF